MVGILCLWLKYWSARVASHHSAFMGNFLTVSRTFLSLSTQWINSPSMEWRRGVSPRFHLIVLCLVWIKRIMRQDKFRILLCNLSGGNPLLRKCIFTIPSNISNGALLWKQPTGLTRWLLPQKSPTTDFPLDSRCSSNRRCCECWVWVGCRCMEFVVAGLCARTWLRLYQTMTNKKSYFWWFGKSKLKKSRVVYILDLFEERGEKWQGDLVCVEHRSLG